MEIIFSTKPHSLEEIFKISDFIIVGELHGICENAVLISDLLTIATEANLPVTIAFEWVLSDDELLGLKNYTQNIQTDFKVPDFFYDSDGRVTITHVELLEKIRKYNSISKPIINIATFGSNAQNREESMSENLLKIHQKIAGLVLVETGSYHAKKFGGGKHKKSFADILDKVARSKNIFIKYESGNMELEGDVYDVKDNEMQNENQENYFDFVVSVPKATAAVNKDLLTYFEKRSILQK